MQRTKENFQRALKQKMLIYRNNQKVVNELFPALQAWGLATHGSFAL